MIASWRGLVVAAAIAIALVGVVAIDLGRAPEVIDRALVPDFDADRVTELVWERTGQPAIRVTRAATGWQLHATAAAAADASAVSDVLATLRGARWHRVGPASAVHAALTIVSAAGRRVLGLGEPIAGTEQAWIVDGERGLVVDRWVVRALDRDALALQIRTPFAEVAGATAIAIEGALGEPASQVALRLAGEPRRLVKPISLLVAPERTGALDQALRAAVIVRRPDGPIGGRGGRGLAIRVEGRAPVDSELAGSCPGDPALVALRSSTGDGCIERTAALAIEDAVRALTQPAAAIAERRPAPIEPVRIALDGIVLDPVARLVNGGAADPARIAELLAALAAPAELAPLPATPPDHELVITDRVGGSLTVELFGERVLARRGEPIALRPGPGAWDVLARPWRALRDASLWLEEPTMISELQLDGATYRRGALLGAWSRPPLATALDNRVVAAIVALDALLAAPRAIGLLDAAPPPAHRIAFVVSPPVGAPIEHALVIGARRPDGCPAEAGDRAVLLPAAVCEAAATLAALTH